MKRIMLAVLLSGALGAQACQALPVDLGASPPKDAHPIRSAAKRIVKFPVALVATVIDKTGELIWHNPVIDAWELAGK